MTPSAQLTHWFLYVIMSPITYLPLLSLLWCMKHILASTHLHQSLQTFAYIMTLNPGGNWVKLHIQTKYLQVLLIFLSTATILKASSQKPSIKMHFLEFILFCITLTTSRVRHLLGLEQKVASRKMAFGDLAKIIQMKQLFVSVILPALFYWQFYTVCMFGAATT